MLVWDRVGAALCWEPPEEPLVIPEEAVNDLRALVLGSALSGYIGLRVGRSKRKKRGVTTIYQ